MNPDAPAPYDGGMDGVGPRVSFLRRAFGEAQLSPDGKNIAVPCPKCRRKDRKKKLAVRTDDFRCHCWVCGLSGRLLNVLVQYRRALVQEYIRGFGGSVLDITAPDEGRPDLQVPSGFRLLAADASGHRAQRALRYLRSRGVTDRDLWYFRFGVSDDPTLFDRVVMPSFDARGSLNFYTGRALDPTAYRKYMNCDAEKKSVVFNELNIDWGRELTLVEGPFDLIKCDENATCLLGSSLSEDSLLFARVFSSRTPIVLALDSDMRDRVWQRMARMLVGYSIPVRMLDLGTRKDVGEMDRDEFLRAKAAARPWERVDALRQKIDGMRP